MVGDLRSRQSLHRRRWRILAVEVILSFSPQRLSSGGFFAASGPSGHLSNTNTANATGGATTMLEHIVTHLLQAAYCRVY